MSKNDGCHRMFFSRYIPMTAVVSHFCKWETLGTVTSADVTVPQTTAFGARRSPFIRATCIRLIQFQGQFQIFYCFSILTYIVRGGKTRIALYLSHPNAGKAVCPLPYKN